MRLVGPILTSGASALAELLGLHGAVEATSARRFRATALLDQRIKQFLESMVLLSSPRKGSRRRGQILAALRDLRTGRPFTMSLRGGIPMAPRRAYSLATDICRRRAFFGRLWPCRQRNGPRYTHAADDDRPDVVHICQGKSGEALRYAML